MTSPHIHSTRRELRTALLSTPAFVVVTAAMAWAIIVSRLVMLRQNNFGTFDYDTGIYDQSIWLLAHGHWFNTVRGMPVFGVHASFALYFFVPFAWLGFGPNLWNSIQCIAIAGCAIPIFVIARRRVQRPWLAVLVALSWLLQPWLSWFAQETFHPEVVAMLFLFSGFMLIDPKVVRPVTRRFDRADVVGIIILFVAMAWKEDVALAVAMIGVVVRFAGRRRVGAWLIIGGLVWFVVFGAWMVPALNGGHSVYSGFYGNLGESGFQVLIHSIFHPHDLWRRLMDNHAGLYFVRMFLPFALLAFGSPTFILIAVPQFIANVLTTASFTFEPHFHYQAIPMVALMLASIETIGKLSLGTRLRTLRSTCAVGLLTATSFIGAKGWGILPIGHQYRHGAWPLARQDNAGWQAAIARVKGHDGVAAHYLGVPHLSHRVNVYTFPNPWTNSYYGTSNDSLGDPTTVNWIIVVPTAMNEDAQRTLADLLSTGEFGDRESVGGVDSYRRLRPAVAD